MKAVLRWDTTQSATALDFRKRIDQSTNQRGRSEDSQWECEEARSVLLSCCCSHDHDELKASETHTTPETTSSMQDD